MDYNARCSALPMPKKSLAKIRRFTIEDIEKILEIEEHAFPKTAYSRETFLSYAKAPSNHFMVLEAGTDIAGYIIFDRGGHVHSTAVTPGHRRKGLGRQLFMHALACLDKGLWLEVRSRNSAAIQFYKALGMKIIGKVSHYYENDDALILALRQKQRAQSPKG